METFKEYMSHGGSLDNLHADELKLIVKSYPWFTTARIFANRLAGKIDPMLALHLVNNPAPKVFLQNLSDDPSRPEESEIINKFLEKGEYKIKPAGDNSDNELVVESEMLPADDEAVSEELAHIYLDQQLYDQARATYRKLSLLYPEKSVYFAEIINQIDAAQQPQESGYN